MPAVGRCAVLGELVVEVDVHGARDVAFEVLGAPVRTIEPPPHIEDADGLTAGDEIGECVGGDEDVGQGFSWCGGVGAARAGRRVR